MGRFSTPPLKFRPPPPTPPLGLATGADELAHASSHPARCRLEWLIERFREDGTYEPMPRGGSTSRLEKHSRQILALISAQRDLTVPEWSTGSPSSKGPSIGGLFGGVTSPIFTNDFRLCPADARENTPLLPVKFEGSLLLFVVDACSRGEPQLAAQDRRIGMTDRDPLEWLIAIIGMRTERPRDSGKRKSLVKIGEVTPPKRPSILGPLELGEPIDHSGTPPPPPVIYGAIFDPPPQIPTPPSYPPLRVGNRGR